MLNKSEKYKSLFLIFYICKYSFEKEQKMKNKLLILFDKVIVSDPCLEFIIQFIIMCCITCKDNKVQGIHKHTYNLYSVLNTANIAYFLPSSCFLLSHFLFLSFSPFLLFPSLPLFSINDLPDRTEITLCVQFCITMLVFQWKHFNVTFNIL